MERDDAVLTRTFGGVGDSAACALWEGFLRCLRVLFWEQPRLQMNSLNELE